MKIIFYDYGTGFLADAHKYHAIDDLQRADHQVVYVNPMQELDGEPSRERSSEFLLDRVRAEHANGGVDLFFSVGWDNSLTPDAVREIGRLGIPTVSFSTDDLSHPYRVRRIASAFDLCWSTASESESILRGYGAKKLVFMPFAANPHLFKPVKAPERESVCFIGTAYGARAHGVCSMAQAGVPVEVHGASPMDIYGTSPVSNPLTRAMTSMADGWERLFNSIGVPGGRKCIAGALKRTVQELLSDPPEKHPMEGNIRYLGAAGFEAMAELLSTSAISFGSIEIASTYVLKEPLLFIRFREFEAAMAGAVHLVNRMPELQGYFEEDKEMLYYGSMDELVDKAKFYLAPERKALRDAIRMKAAARARAEHTWLHRFRRIGEELGLKL